MNRTDVSSRVEAGWRRLALWWLGFVVGAAALGGAEPRGWTPVPEDDLRAVASASQPGCDAEILLWRREVDLGSSVVTFVRTKLYTAEGVRKSGIVHLDRGPDERFGKISARMVKPSGRVEELSEDQFKTSKLVAFGRREVQRTSFAFPGLEAGDVIEYRWTIRSRDGGDWFYCQQELPVRELRCSIEESRRRPSVTWHNCGQVERTWKDDRCDLVIRNLPAFAEEDLMPPEETTRGWIEYMSSGVGLYLMLSDLSPGRMADRFEDDTSPNAALRQKAAELTKGATTDREKAARLYEFCQAEIMNLKYSGDPRAAEEGRRARNFIRTARETFAAKSGTPWEIDLLFAGLARAAGLAPRLGQSDESGRPLLSARSWGQCVVLLVDQQWIEVSPGDYFVPFGYADAADEGEVLRVIDGKQVLRIRLPVAPAAWSELRRQGRFVLEEDGTLTGTVEEHRTGHLAVDLRRLNRERAQSEVDEQFAAGIRRRLPTAEVTEVRWQDLQARAVPVIVRYAVRVPGYAEAVGKRLAFAPGFFQSGAPALLTAETRRYDLKWPHTWSEKDDMEIVLPAGFAPEATTAPSGVRDRSGTFAARYELGYARGSRTLRYVREFTLGAEGMVSFNKGVYPIFRSLYAHRREADEHSVLLRPVPEARAAN